MIFNSFVFLGVFLPVLVVLFCLSPIRPFRRELLLFFSLVFYGYSGVEHVLVLIFGVLWTYLLTRSGIEQNRWKLTVAIVGPLLALVYYKYSGFLLSIVQLDAHEESANFFNNVVLPVGISFFTFQMISLAVERYRGRFEDVSFRNYFLYISCFPQLVAGPIVRFDQVSGAIRSLPESDFTVPRLQRAIGYVCFGLFLKVVIADSLNLHIQPIVEKVESAGALNGVFVILCYSFQIYFDFYGYSLVAIGLGCLFGFNFPANFDKPYGSANPREFWRRWHMSLSFWIRDYLYIPLGGNRAYVRNILIVFLICGLWHGAGWNFILWGLYHGLLICLYGAARGIWDKAPKVSQIFLTFLLVGCGWLLFLFDLRTSLSVLEQIFFFRAGEIMFGTASLLILAFAVGVCFLVDVEKIVESEKKKIWLQGYSFLVSCMFLTSLVFLGRSTSFIYFRF